ncbi:MAG: anti-sigma factor, partial [Achromobacter sp.]|nr:anti-sigma factor [Achromobacter sp.]
MPTPSDQELHAYADGQLDAERRREVERYLADHPDAAREVDAIRRQTDELRRQHADLGRFAPPPRLDPARIRLAQATRRRRARALAAAA